MLKSTEITAEIVIYPSYPGSTDAITDSTDANTDSTDGSTDNALLLQI